MPKRPAPACRQPGCPRLAADNGFCQEDAVKQGRVSYAVRGSRRERGYPANWEKLRLFILARDPVCKGCDTQLSTEVDHIQPLERGGTNAPANLQGLDKSCHSRKTSLEQRLSDPGAVMRLLREQAGAPALPPAEKKS